jgi:hypothetical protein
MKERHKAQEEKRNGESVKRRSGESSIKTAGGGLDIRLKSQPYKNLRYEVNQKILTAHDEEDNKNY